MRRHAAIGLVALLAGGGAAAALGSAGDGTATTVGDASENVVSAAYGTALIIQAHDQTGLRPFGVPAGGGVVTSWTVHLARSTAAGDLSLEALTPRAGANEYVVANRSTGHVEIGGNRTITVPARMAVGGGDRLSLQAPAGADIGTVNVAGGDGDIRVVSGTPTVGQTITSQNYATTAHLILEAVVEPDADHDGFGDLTQDDCVADAARQAPPCGADVHLALTAPATVAREATTTLTATVTATGGPVTASVVSVVLPSGLALVGAPGCTGTTTLTCPLGNLPRNGNAAVPITVRAVADGAQTVYAGADAASPDPAAADNGAGVTLTVVPPAEVKTSATTAAVADTIAPTVSLTAPSCPKTLSERACTKRRAERSRYRTLRLVAADTGGSGVARVEVSVARRAGKKLDAFDGKRFKRASSAAFRKAAGSGASWTLKLPALRAGTYVLRLRATDKAGNVSKVTTRTLHLR